MNSRPTDSTKLSAKTAKRNQQKAKQPPVSLLFAPFSWLKELWSKGFWQKAALILAAILIAWTAGMYGIAQWYIHRHADEPLVVGATFIPRYARYLGVEPQATMDAMIDDLGIRQFRLVSYWDDIEQTPDQYNFDELDWQFDKAEAADAKISLAIGLRQPRWPECHIPGWAAAMPMDEWSVHLKEFMSVVIERYKDRPALVSYQLENEFFMTVFGICPDHTRERLVDEYHFVKSLDSEHPVIISRSNNWIGIPYNEPRADKFAISVYKRVWDKTLTKRYFEYPLPAWFYATLAGAGEIVTGRDMIIHELQAESWLPEGYDMISAPKEELDKSMNAQRLADRFEYGRATGMKEIYLWGVEWWYARMINHNDPELWNTAREQYRQQD